MSDEALNYFYDAIERANYFWILLALFLSFIAYILRAYRWKFTLEALGYETNFWNRYHAMMIGYLMNLTIPRAGEATRAAILMRSEDVPFPKSFGTIISERAIDLILLGLVSLITMFIAYDDFFEIYERISQTFSNPKSENSINLKFWIYTLIILGFGMFLFLLMVYPKLRNKIIGFVKDVLKGIISIFKCKQPLLFFMHTGFIWVLYITYFGIAFLSLQETAHFPIEGILMGFVAGSLGISFTNGGIGAFPFLVGLVIVFYLQNENPNALAIGNALGMLIWVSQTILLIVLGLISLILFRKKNNNKIHP